MANFDYLGQQAKLTELQALAQALAAKQANPQPMGQMVGKYFIPNYGGQIAQGLDSISEAKVSHDLPERVAQFSAGTRAATGEATKSFMDLYKKDPNAAVAMAQGSPLPTMQEMGKEAAKQQMKTFAPKASRQFAQGGPGTQFFGVNPDGSLNRDPIATVPWTPKLGNSETRVVAPTGADVNIDGMPPRPNGLAGGLTPRPNGFAGGVNVIDTQQPAAEVAARKAQAAAGQSLGGEEGKLIVEQYKKLTQEIQPQMQSLDEAINALQSGTYNGIMSMPTQFFARLGQALGMQQDPKLANTQEYRAAVLGLLGNLGGQISDADRLVKELTVGADTGMEGEALQRILLAAQARLYNQVLDYKDLVTNAKAVPEEFKAPYVPREARFNGWKGLKFDEQRGRWELEPRPNTQPAPQQGAQPAAPTSQTPSGKTFNVTTDEEYHEAMKQAKPGDIIQTPSGSFPVK